MRLVNHFRLIDNLDWMKTMNICWGILERGPLVWRVHTTSKGLVFMKFMELSPGV